jgi:hypothetical protein
VPPLPFICLPPLLLHIQRTLGHLDLARRPLL